MQGQNAATNQPHTGGNTQGMSGANLTNEQRTKIRETVLNRNNVPRVNRVDFAMNIGTVVPDSVRIVEVPPTLVEIDSAWRGDEYFVVQDEIVIVDQNRKIVATLPVGSESAGEAAGTTSTGGGGTMATADLSSDEIREIQTVLIEKGFLKGGADGMFGPETREALIAFQKREGIEATGSIDTRTVGSLGLQNKIKAGGAHSELGTGSSPRTGEGARNTGHSEGMKDREPLNANEANRGTTTSEPVPPPMRRYSPKQCRRPSRSARTKSASSNWFINLLRVSPH